MEAPWAQRSSLGAVGTVWPYGAVVTFQMRSPRLTPMPQGDGEDESPRFHDSPYGQDQLKQQRFGDVQRVPHGRYDLS